LGSAHRLAIKMMSQNLFLPILLLLAVSCTAQQELPPELRAAIEAAAAGVGAQVEAAVVKTEKPAPVDDVRTVEEQYAEGGAEEPSKVSVDTILGTITGIKQKMDNGEDIYSFLGIPYAKPPVASRRFKAPEPVTAYGNHDAIGFRGECLQYAGYGPDVGKIKGSEDCLYLNIFSPSLTRSKAALKPVMVWIHGGGFVQGSGAEYIPAQLAKQDVVVVTLNYRLAGLGFLTFGNDLVAGNMGLRDQIEALKWVKRYINSFGGDPDQITIFGESSGGNSVNALYVSPLSRGLFNRAIMQSGTMLFSRNKYEKTRQERTAQALARKFNCPSLELDEDMLECLQKVPAKVFIEKSQFKGTDPTQPREEIERAMWLPVVDAYTSNPVLPEHPFKLLKTGEFAKVPVLLGTVANEGAVNIMQILGPAPNKEMLWGFTGAQQLQLTRSGNITETEVDELLMMKVITKYYTNSNYDLRETGQGWMDMFTDALYLSPAQKVAQFITENGQQVFNYHFTHVGQKTVSKLFGAPDNSLAPVHGDDLFYLFQVIAGMEIKGEEDNKVSDIMIEYWTNFAKYGNPSPFLDTDIPHWKPYGQEKRYMEIKVAPEMKGEILPDRMLLWQKVLWDKMEDEVDRAMFLKQLLKNLPRGIFSARK